MVVSCCHTGGTRLHPPREKARTPTHSEEFKRSSPVSCPAALCTSAPQRSHWYRCFGTSLSWGYSQYIAQEQCDWLVGVVTVVSSRKQHLRAPGLRRSAVPEAAGRRGAERARPSENFKATLKASLTLPSENLSSLRWSVLQYMHQKNTFYTRRALWGRLSRLPAYFYRCFPGRASHGEGSEADTARARRPCAAGQGIAGQSRAPQKKVQKKMHLKRGHSPPFFLHLMFHITLSFAAVRGAATCTACSLQAGFQVSQSAPVSV